MQAQKATTPAQGTTQPKITTPPKPASKPDPESGLDSQFCQKTNERILKLEKGINGIQDSVISLSGAIQDVTEAVAMLKNIKASSAVGKEPENGLMKSPEGNTVFKNPFDPLAMVEIALIPYEGYIPRIMQFPDPSDKSGLHLLSYNFRLDDKGNIHYYLPRKFAAGQLAAKGGIKTVLVFPDELPVVMKNAKMTRETVTVKKHPEIQPIFERD